MVVNVGKTENYFHVYDRNYLSSMTLFYWWKITLFRDQNKQSILRRGINNVLDLSIIKRVRPSKTSDDIRNDSIMKKVQMLEQSRKVLARCSIQRPIWYYDDLIEKLYRRSTCRHHVGEKRIQSSHYPELQTPRIPVHAVYTIPSGHTKFKSRKLYGIYICHRLLLAFTTHFYHKKIAKTPVGGDCNTSFRTNAQ